jgi:hypothetical protein
VCPQAAYGPEGTWKKLPAEYQRICNAGRFSQLQASCPFPSSLVYLDDQSLGVVITICAESFWSSRGIVCVGLRSSLSDSSHIKFANLLNKTLKLKIIGSTILICGIAAFLLYSMSKR